MSNFKKTFLNSKGRISASQYVVLAVMLIILSPLLVLLSLPLIAILPPFFKVIVGTAFFVLLIWSCIALAVKRLHDLGHDGGWILLLLVPLVNVILFLYLILGKGQPRTNRFGRRPAPAPELLSIICYAMIFLGMFYSLKSGVGKISGLLPPSKLPAVKESTGSRRFYSIARSNILLSRTQFSTKNKSIEYIMQIVIGKDKNGYHPPQLHIKRVIDGRIEKDCLSYLFNKPNSKMPNDSRMSSFEYHLPNSAPIDKVYGFSSIYVRTADPSWNKFERMFGMGFIGAGVGYSRRNKGLVTKQSKIYLNASLIGPMGWGKMVPEEKVETKKTEWRIKDNIVSAFGRNSNCNPLGHNRRCSGCLFQR